MRERKEEIKRNKYSLIQILTRHKRGKELKECGSQPILLDITWRREESPDSCILLTELMTQLMLM